MFQPRWTSLSKQFYSLWPDKEMINKPNFTKAVYCSIENYKCMLWDGNRFDWKLCCVVVLGKLLCWGYGKGCCNTKGDRGCEGVAFNNHWPVSCHGKAMKIMAIMMMTIIMTLTTTKYALTWFIYLYRSNSKACECSHLKANAMSTMKLFSPNSFYFYFFCRLHYRRNDRFSWSISICLHSRFMSSVFFVRLRNEWKYWIKCLSICLR